MFNLDVIELGYELHTQKMEPSSENIRSLIDDDREVLEK